MALMSGEYKPGLIPGFFIAPLKTRQNHSKPVKTIQPTIIA